MHGPGSAGGEWGISPLPPQMTRGDITPQLEVFLEMFFLEAELSTVKKKFENFVYPLKFISGRNPVDISADLLTTKIFKKYQEVAWSYQLRSPCRDHKETANTFYSHNFQFIHFKSK
jgi:hypothetical protein